MKLRTQSAHIYFEWKPSFFPPFCSFSFFPSSFLPSVLSLFSFHFKTLIFFFFLPSFWVLHCCFLTLSLSLPLDPTDWIYHLEKCHKSTDYCGQTTRKLQLGCVLRLPLSGNWNGTPQHFAFWLFYKPCLEQCFPNFICILSSQIKPNFHSTCSNFHFKFFLHQLFF